VSVTSHSRERYILEPVPKPLVVGGVTGAARTTDAITAEKKSEMTFMMMVERRLKLD